jgi:hypothetical protein
MLSPNSTFLLVESPFLWAPQIPKSPWLPGSHLCHLLRWADVPRDLEPDTWNWQWDAESDPKLCQSPAGDAKTLRIAGNPAVPETSEQNLFWNDMERRNMAGRLAAWRTAASLTPSCGPTCCIRDRSRCRSSRVMEKGCRCLDVSIILHQKYSIIMHNIAE